MEQKKSTQKRHQLLNAALDVFSLYGFNGASLDEIAQIAEMHKSNIFYYYENKEALYVEVLTTVLQKWLAPLQTLEAELEPEEAITNYLMQKIEVSRTQPKASRLFALEIIQGAPHILPILKGPLKKLFKRKVKVISAWQEQGKISAQILKASLQKLLREMEQSQKRQKISGKGQKKETVYHGKQSMEKLKAHNQELSNIEVTDGNIRSFEKYARKYDIDYCLKKDRSAEPPKYYVFFKAKEVDSITAAFKEYTGWQLKKSKKVSVRKKLYLAMERVAKHRQREKMKQKNRGQEH